MRPYSPSHFQATHPEWGDIFHVWIVHIDSNSGGFIPGMQQLRMSLLSIGVDVQIAQLDRHFVAGLSLDIVFPHAKQSDLIVLTFDTAPESQLVAEMLLNSGATMGVNVLMFPLGAVQIPFCEPDPISVVNILRPTNNANHHEWLQVLAAILHAAFAMGLIGFCWADVRSFLSYTKNLEWSVHPSVKEDEVFAEAVREIQSISTAINSKYMMVIFMGGIDVSMETIGHVHAALFPANEDNKVFLMAAPFTSWLAPQLVVVYG